MLHAHQSILLELYIPPSFYLKLSICADLRNPLFMRSIATPSPNHNISSEWHTQCCFGVVSQRFGAAYQPYPTARPPPPPVAYRPP